MNIWFTSDLHLGHEHVAEVRGFHNVLDHDEAIRWNWHDQVGARDQVWVLGDIAVSNPRYALEMLSAWPGEKHLVWGNHDKGHPMHRDAHRKAAQYTELRGPRGMGYDFRAPAFASTQAFARRRIEGREVLLSHFPYEGDTEGRDEDRHPQYRLRNAGLPLIHGHTHSAQELTWAYHPEGREIRYAIPQVHVGLDAWGLRLAPLERVARILAGVTA